MFRSVRVRLTFWYVLIFGVLLGGFSAFVYTQLSRDLYERFDLSLAGTADVTAAFFRNEVAENGGKVASGAAETLSELPLRATRVAIFEGSRALAASDADIVQFVLLQNLVEGSRSANGPAFATLPADRRGGERVVAVPAHLQGSDCFVAAMEPLDSLREQLAALQRIFWLALPATLLVAGLGGFLLAKKSLAPVVAMSNRAAQISAKNLHERLPVRNADDELGRLASVFNELLSRLERSFESMRGFMTDASHELRTPLAIIRGEAEVALSKERAAGEYKESLAIVQDEGRRLSRLVDDMLDLARADAGHRPLRVEEFYLNDLLEECCRAAQALTLQKGISLRLAPAADTPFRGDQTLLRQMTLNLLDNAIRYTPAGGSVSVELAREASGVRIIVADTGIGIPPESAARVFERFYRADKSRSRSEGGSGLGLSIVKWVAEAHNGSVELASQAGQGSTFTVLLPIEA